MRKQSTRLFRRFRRDERGAAAIEFAAAAMLLIVGVLNGVDFGYYTYRRMEVENAAQVGAQVAWKTCYDTSSMLPATTNCGAVTDAIKSAIQTTSLASNVSLLSGYPAEGYYCVDGSGMLHSVGSLTSRPSDCSAVGDATTTPGDYLQVGVTCPYAPLFPGLSLMGAWGITSITGTSWVRLG
jgi:Flp pilus assembly pilin Flp